MFRNSIINTYKSVQFVYKKYLKSRVYFPSYAPVVHILFYLFTHDIIVKHNSSLSFEFVVRLLKFSCIKAILINRFFNWLRNFVKFFLKTWNCLVLRRGEGGKRTHGPIYVKQLKTKVMSVRRDLQKMNFNLIPETSSCEIVLSKHNG